MNEDRASRYHRLKRRAQYVSTAAGAGWLAWLLASGASARMAGWGFAMFARVPGLAGRASGIAVLAILIALGFEAVTLPFDFVRSFVIERRYGLSFEPLGTWAVDHLKGLAIGLPLSVIAVVVMYGTMRLAGALWWLASAVLFGAAAVGLSRLAPILLMPLFYQFRPLDREALRERLLELSRRAGVPVLGVFEWGLGEKTTRANAALVGIADTRRIIVSDTLLKDYSEDEIAVILAHELGHHVHYDLWSGLALETIAIGAALWTAGLVIAQAGPRWGITRVSDPAGLPLLALAGGLVSLFLTPLTNAWSRFNERRADRFALTLTRRPAPFISAMRRLAAQNLADERPSKPVFWFFHTHPTIEQRIAAAKAYADRGDPSRSRPV